MDKIDALGTDTVCAPASAAGGAVSIIRISGPQCFPIVDSLVVFRKGKAAETPGYRLKRGDFLDIDDVLVGIFRAPLSYTGEDCAEIYCHASPYIVSRILEELCKAGCRSAAPGEFTRRAFLNGKMDLAQAEAVADLIAASSQAQHKVASSQLRGGYSALLRDIRARLLELSTLVELELDFSEEEVEFADRKRLEGLLVEAAERCRSLAGSFRLGNAIKNGVPVAIAGRPNSGKSTLLNALLRDDRAIVSDIPGTTRDTIEENRLLGGTLFRFIDTAGLRDDAGDEIERLGIGRSLDKIRDASIVIAVVDLASESAQDGQSPLAGLREISSRMDPLNQKLIIALNKADLPLAGLREISSKMDPLNQKLIIALNEADLPLAGERLAEMGASGLQTGADGSARRGSDGLAKADSSANGGSDGLAKADSSAHGGGRGQNEAADTQRQDFRAGTAGATADRDAALRSAPMIALSAKNGSGLDRLEDALIAAADTRSYGDILVTNQRHATALAASADALDAALSALRRGLPTDLLAEDLRAAISSLGSITGEISTDEVLGEIFKGFCIGK